MRKVSEAFIVRKVGFEGEHCSNGRLHPKRRSRDCELECSMPQAAKTELRNMPDTKWNLDTNARET